LVMLPHGSSFVSGDALSLRNCAQLKLREQIRWNRASTFRSQRCSSVEDPSDAEHGGSVWQRRSLCSVGACAAGVDAGATRPRVARAEATAKAEQIPQWLETAKDRAVGKGRADGIEERSMDSKERLLLGDPEVEQIRRMQREFSLWDVKRQQWTTLEQALKPGELLYEADAICLGEIHTSDADHTVQRLIIDALTYQLFLELRKSEGVDPSATRGVTPQNRSPKRLAVGVEYFQRQQQNVLDELIFAGKMKGDEFRKAIEWDKVWNYEWSIFSPLFRFCQLNVTRIVGLNVPFEFSLQVSREGLKSLPEEVLPLLPALDLSNQRHRRRFEDLIQGVSVESSVARMKLPLSDFKPKMKDSMYESQCLWDEYMAETAQKYIEASGGRLVILAGINHIWRDAIPDRFEAISRRAGGKLRCASLAPWRGSLEPSELPTYADYLWCASCPGGGGDAAQAMQDMRKRLSGKTRVFPAGYI